MSKNKQRNRDTSARTAWKGQQVELLFLDNCSAGKRSGGSEGGEREGEGGGGGGIGEYGLGGHNKRVEDIGRPHHRSQRIPTARKCSWQGERFLHAGGLAGRSQPPPSQAPGQR
eukprot:755796-Hanusia_phi.AAC.2